MKYRICAHDTPPLLMDLVTALLILPVFRRAIPISFPACMETVGLEAPADCLTLHAPN